MFFKTQKNKKKSSIAPLSLRGAVRRTEGILQPVLGFTLIELLVVVAITGAVAAAAVPNFMASIDKRSFRAEVQSVYDLIHQARSDALAFKKCPNGNTAMSWDVEFIPHKPNGSVKLLCQHSGGTEEIETFAYTDGKKIRTVFNHITYDKYPTTVVPYGSHLDDLQATADSNHTVENSTDEKLILSYLPGRASVVITHDNTGTKILQSLAKMDWYYEGPYFDPGILESTICISRVSGFPLLNLNSPDCKTVMP